MTLSFLFCFFSKYGCNSLHNSYKLFLDTRKLPFQSDSGTSLLMKFSHHSFVLLFSTQHHVCDVFFIKNLSSIFFLEMANMTREFCDSKYHWFINNIINMKFDCPADKIYEITKNVILLAFSMFLFFLQNSYYYTIFYFLYFCI